MSGGRRRREYTLLGEAIGCTVVVIEAVYDDDNATDIDGLLDDLRQSGAAEVVNKIRIKEDFDEACVILSTHKL